MASPLALNDCRWEIKSAVLNVLALEPTQQERDAIADFLQDGGQVLFARNGAALDNNTQADLEQPSSTVRTDGFDAEGTAEHQHSPANTDIESIQAFVDEWWASHSVDRPTVAQGNTPPDCTKQEPHFHDHSIPRAHPELVSAAEGPIVDQATTSDKSSTTASNAPSASQPKKSVLTPHKMTPKAQQFLRDLQAFAVPTGGVTFENPALGNRTPPVRRRDMKKGVSSEHTAGKTKPKTSEPKRLLEIRAVNDGTSGLS